MYDLKDLALSHDFPYLATLISRCIITLVRIFSRENAARHIIKTMKQNGYVQKLLGIKTKRFCQTLDLKNEPELIAAYKKLHEEGHVWREILNGIKEVGILEMEIYLLENRLFMIVETPEDFIWDESMAKLAKLPKQEEWEALTGKYQKTKDGATSSEKWQLMERIFHLY